MDINQYERALEAVDYLQNRTDNFAPRYGIILGTGLGKLANEIKVHAEIPYDEIPYFPVSTVQGHAGKLILGHLEGVPVVAMSGRFHYYEGYNARHITFPVRVMKMMKIERLFISSAVGSVNGSIESGDIVLIKDHINLLPENPLRGPNDSRFGVRFPDMKDAYDHKLNARALEIAKAQGVRAHTGVYLALQGPNLETPAEYRFANIIGADVVGMSTVPEVIIAKHMELPVLVTAVVSNKCFPLEEIQETTLEDVLRVVAETESKLTGLIKALINEIK
jgi:purine-nucleoside phosphorylase